MKQKANAAKILFISQEITPYLPDSEIAGIGRHLPQAIQEKGREIRTFMPRYGCVNERRNQLHEVIRLSGMNLIIDDTDHPLIIKVASIQSARMQVYFIDNEDYFSRKSLFKDADEKEFDDNDERCIFFARGVLETVKKLRWAPDIVHCHGWIGSLVPLYIKKAYNDDPFFKESKIVFSLYDDDFKTPFKENFQKNLMLDGVDKKDLDAIKKQADYVSLEKLAMDFSDGVIQGSAEINQELADYAQQKNLPFLPYQTPETYVDAYNEFYNQILDK
ncbi:MAG: glycogen/starch synthase [Prevotellaceae bacterium]|jgi:starch synthase|nr:glycogen/starch synthase [Prevotellaceae bacterium]